MNYPLYLYFLGLLSGLSLTILLLLRILDFANVIPKQKIILLKIGLMMIVLAPFIFNLLRLSSCHALIIALPNKFFTQISTHQLSATLTKQINWSFYILIMYSIGFFLMLFRIGFSYLNARKQLNSSYPAVIQGQPVFLNEKILSPLSFGLPKAKIYFPFDTEAKWTSREIQLCLAHEKKHLEHNDSLWKLISLIVQALLFFVPWSYYLHRRLELEMEIYCDEKTCLETKADVYEYGNLLLDIACTKSKNLIFTNMTDSNIKKRLLAMKSKKRSATFLVSFLSVAFLLVGSTTIAMASGITDKKSLFKISSKFVVDGKLISSPLILANANQKAVIVIRNTKNIPAQSLRMEIVARDAEKFTTDNAIAINFNVQYMNGEEKMHSSQQVIVEPKKEDKIRLSSDSSHSYELYVFAERE